MATKRFERFYAWYEKENAHTLWCMDGPRNTDIDEIRMVNLETGDLALITIYSADHGFAIYRYSEN